MKWENSANLRLIQHVFGYGDGYRFMLKSGIDQAIEEAMSTLKPEEYDELCNRFIVSPDRREFRQQIYYRAILKLRKPKRNKGIRDCISTQNMTEFWYDYLFPEKGLAPETKKDWNTVMVYELKNEEYLVKMVRFDRFDMKFHSEFSIVMDEDLFKAFSSYLEFFHGTEVISSMGLTKWFGLESMFEIDRFISHSGNPSKIYMLEKQTSRLCDIISQYNDDSDHYYTGICFGEIENGKMKISVLEYMPEVFVKSRVSTFSLDEEEGLKLKEEVEKEGVKVESYDECMKKYGIRDENEKVKDFYESAKGDVYYVW